MSGFTNDQTLVVVNTNDLEAALDKIINNIGEAVKQGVKIEDFQIPNIQITISDGNPNHSSTLTSTMMKSFVGFQNEIYDIFKIANGRELVEAEKKAAELRIKVESGSTNIIIPICEAIAAGVPNMSLEQTVVVMHSVIGVVAVICLIGVLKEGVKLYSKERILKLRQKSKQEETAAQVELSRIEIEQKTLELQYRGKQDDRNFQERLAQIEKDKESTLAWKETIATSFKSVEDMIVHSSSAEKYLYRGLAQEAEEAKVSIDGITYQAETLKERGSIERRPRIEKEEKIIHVKGNFKTELISYIDADVRKINISGIGEDGQEYTFDGLPVSKSALTPELYKLINDGAPLYWNIDVTMKGEKWDSIMLIELKKPVQNP